jgi:peptidoglycan L-alanyl-D-glutamate endopeptidase CwlK
MGFTLTPADEKMLNGVHPDLQKVVARAAQLSDRPFRVLEGKRTLARQKELVARGASQTLKSRHLTGHAVDIAPLEEGRVSWSWPLYYPLAKIMKQAAKELNVPLEWGGDWKSFKDGPHWQLSWVSYPARTNDEAVEKAKPITNKTEARVANEKAATAGTGGVTAAVVGAEPVIKATEALATQQGEITSGDITRIIVALIIIGLTVWAVVRSAS